MNRLSVYLGSLLVFQLLFAAGLFAFEQLEQPTFETEKLLSFNQHSITKVVISDAENHTSLIKKEGQWQLTDVQMLPANSSKVISILEKLGQLSSTWPTTTTTSSHQRFEVSSEQFQRRIQLFEQDKRVGELYLGTSPGFKKVHVRVAGNPHVYTVELATYEFPTAPSEWLDKNLLALESVKAIHVNDVQLLKQGDDWRLVKDRNKPTDEVTQRVNTEIITPLVNTLENLTVTGIADPQLDLSDDAAVLEVTGEKPWTYQLLSADKRYYIKRNDRSTVFTLNERDYKRLAGTVQEDLLVSPTPMKDSNSVTTQPTNNNEQ